MVLAKYSGCCGVLKVPMWGAECEPFGRLSVALSLRVRLLEQFFGMIRCLPVRHSRVNRNGTVVECSGGAWGHESESGHGKARMRA
jgi:hypothetical protein